MQQKSSRGTLFREGRLVCGLRSCRRHNTYLWEDRPAPDRIGWENSLDKSAAHRSYALTPAARRPSSDLKKRLRIAVSVTGAWRSFGDPRVIDDLEKKIIRGVSANGTHEVGLFLCAESSGFNDPSDRTTNSFLSDKVVRALRSLHPRVLVVDRPTQPPPPHVLYSEDLLWGQHEALAHCFSLIEEDERGTSSNWDFIIRARTDLILWTTLKPIHNYPKDAITVPAVFAPSFVTVSYGLAHTTYFASDQLAILPRHLAVYYFRDKAFLHTGLDPRTVTFIGYDTGPEYSFLPALEALNVSVSDDQDFRQLGLARTDGYLYRHMAVKAEEMYQQAVRRYTTRDELDTTRVFEADLSWAERTLSLTGDSAARGGFYAVTM